MFLAIPKFDFKGIQYKSRTLLLYLKPFFKREHLLVDWKIITLAITYFSLFYFRKEATAKTENGQHNFCHEIYTESQTKMELQKVSKKSRYVRNKMAVFLVFFESLSDGTKHLKLAVYYF